MKNLDRNKHDTNVVLLIFNIDLDCIWTKCQMSQNTPSLLYESATFRITVFIDSLYFQVIFNTIIPDHNAGVFNPPSSTNTNSGTSLDGLIQVLYGGLGRWDAVYFTHILLFSSLPSFHLSYTKYIATSYTVWESYILKCQNVWLSMETRTI